MTPSNYEKFPSVNVPGCLSSCWAGWQDICERIERDLMAAKSAGKKIVFAVDCYTGVHLEELEATLRIHLNEVRLLTTGNLFKTAAEIDTLVGPFLGGSDPLFGYLCNLNLIDFFDAVKLGAFQESLSNSSDSAVVLGVGAAICAKDATVIYADMPRWEGQLRQRRGEVDNLATQNRGVKASLQYKRSYFVDWRVLDRHKRTTMDRWSYYLDTTIGDQPKMVTGDAFRRGLVTASHRPFRLVPFFDPAPWGGQWMKDKCDLDRTADNYGWCFDCVPEENSLLMDFGLVVIESPASDLVFYQPVELLGEAVYGLFGAEFPIRFDFLDTIGGGNLSLQVHPLNEYIREKFGMFYTQDESYYMLDAAPGATVYLGLKTDANVEEMFDALGSAQTGGAPFDAENFVNQLPAQKHDHYLIPAGTIHCSGAGSMVLEISATPYIFTFKLWDWERLGLDGLPRPINLKHGRANVQSERRTDWVVENLVNRFEPVSFGDGWREERTGLHRLEFIETRRHWFTGVVPHDTQGTLNVLNLVEGVEAVVESPEHIFQPFVVHYAETFIVPASVGRYTIRPSGVAEGSDCATMKAFVRLNNR